MLDSVDLALSGVSRGSSFVSSPSEIDQLGTCPEKIGEAANTMCKDYFRSFSIDSAAATSWLFECFSKPPSRTVSVECTLAQESVN
jgi:hypothetical protein